MPNAERPKHVGQYVSQLCQCQLRYNIHFYHGTKDQSIEENHIYNVILLVPLCLSLQALWDFGLEVAFSICGTT